MRHPLNSIVAALVLALVCTAGASAQAPMSPSDEARLASFFAPVLLFHPDEQFYPTRVFAPLGDLSDPTAEDVEALAIQTRVRAYLTIPVAQRLRSVTVYYRVSPLGSGGRRVIIEYFFYYLFNPYRVRGSLFPFGFGASHNHDFERLAIVVSWPDTAGDAAWEPARARVVAIYPSDHGHDVPDNVWRARGDEQVPRPLHVIVELGSHAMAADINGNGRFDPGIDMNVPAKFVWGIRDHGASWAGFKPRYMTVRDTVEPVGRAGERGRDDSIEAAPAYGLAPVALLTDGMALIARLAGDQAFGRASWTVRLFGETDPRTIVRVPVAGMDPERGSGEAAAAAYERGFSIAVSNLHGVISAYGGGRWLVAGPARLPDLLVDGQAAINNERRVFYVVDSFASYRVDYISRLLVGVGTLGEMRRGADCRVDLLAGAEFRLGHLRIRPLARRNQPLRRTWADLRITYVF